MGSSTSKPRGAILLVEDDPDLASLHSAYLQADGHEVRAVADGQSALDAVAEREPDIVLLDVLLPDISGFEVCRRIKSDSPLVSVILVTSLNSIESRTEAFEANADEFVAKPAIREEMIARVNAMLRLRAAVADREATQLALEEEKRERIRQLFGRYVSRTLVDRLTEQEPSDWSELLGHTERMDCTVMFTDVRGFTALSETLVPEDVVGLLNEHFSALTRATHAHGGTVLNMTGDGLLVAFGAPAPHKAPNLSAILAAEEMHRDFRPIVARLRAEHGIETGLGIGIHAGPVICGNVGSESYLAFTVIGDVVNVAARAQARAGAGRTMVTEQVWKGVASGFSEENVRRHGEIELRGRSGKIKLFEIDMSSEAVAT